MRRIVYKEALSRKELRDIIISVLVVSLIFAYNNANPASTIALFPLFLLIVIVTFLFHELAHRFVARRFGCASFYKLWIEGIIFGLLFMLVGVKFVAPGAVVIYPYQFGRWGFRYIGLTATEMGLIAFSGIGVNLLLSMVFKPLTGILIIQGVDLFGSLAFVNAWLAFFNLLPIPPLDGGKIFRWKPWFWFLLFLTSILLIFL